MTRQYEALYLVSGNHTEEALPGIKEKVNGLITKFGGTITFDDSLGKKRLAYAVDNVRHGYYMLVEFEIAGEQLKQLDKDISTTPEVLRHTIVKRDLKAPRITSLTPITGERVAPDKPEATPAPRHEPRKAPTASPIAAAAPVVPQKVDLEKLDEKLDDILKGDII
jgi:small subunit ribosomal protein S6